jgi:subtilisin family serine protease
MLSWVALFSLILPVISIPPASAQEQVSRRAAQAGQTGQLASHARELTKRAHVVEAGAQQETTAVRRAVEALLRNSRNGAALVGDDLTQARAAVESLARRVTAGDVPATLLNCRVYALDVRDLVSDSQETKRTGEFNRRLTSLLREVETAERGAILFVEGFDSLLSAQNDESRAALDALAAMLARGRGRVIFEVSTTGFDLYLSQNAVIRPLIKIVRMDAAEQTAEEEEEEKEETAETEAANGGFVGDKLSPDLRQLISSATSTGRVRLILQGDELGNEELRRYLEANGAKTVGSYAGLGARAVELPLDSVEQLASRRGIGYISLDRPTSALGGHVAVTTGAEDIATMQEVSATGVVTTRKINGKGIGIAVLDSGVYAAHNAFLDAEGRSRVVYSKDFTGEGRTDDPFGHGTHVAALAAGSARLANGNYAGIAPEANIINLRVLNSKGTGTTSRLLNALNWVYNNRALYKIQVVNMSLGTAAVDSYRNDPVCRAVRKLVDAGVVVAAAAGNDGKDAQGRKIYGRIHSPGNEPSALTVGASNTFGTDSRADDVVTTYSSRGPTRSFWTDAQGVVHYDHLIKPDLIAPGNSLVSAESPNNSLLAQNPQLSRSDNTANSARMMAMSGTSMATPIVAGAAALLLQINPKLTPNMIKALMMYTAQQLRGFNAFEQGAGQLNISGAARLARVIRTDLSAATPLGTPIFFATPPAPRTTIAGHTFIWSRGIIMGYTFATGEALGLYQKIYGLGVMMADGVTISEGTLLADRSILTRGLLLSEAILTSNGSIMSDGVPFCASGTLFSDGAVLADRMVFGDGSIMSDGAVLSDGSMFADSTQAQLTLLYGEQRTAPRFVPGNNR